MQRLEVAFAISLYIVGIKVTEIVAQQLPRDVDSIEIPVNDIAHRLVLETNTVTPLLQRMEKQGIVVRKRGKEDKRQQIVSLTEKGKAMEEEAYSIIPAGMGKELSSCPFKLDDYVKFAGELDTIINTLIKR